MGRGYEQGIHREETRAPCPAKHSVSLMIQEQLLHLLSWKSGCGPTKVGWDWGKEELLPRGCGPDGAEEQLPGSQ